MNLEDVKAYWNSRPCNIRHSSKPIGTKEYFDEVEAKKYKVEPHIPRFAEFEKWKGKHVLEIGCGIGTDTVNFMRSGVESLMAVDLSIKSLELTSRRLFVMGFFWLWIWLRLRIRCWRNHATIWICWNSRSWRNISWFSRKGENFLYAEQALIDALHDWNGGDVKNGDAVLLVLTPKKK
jgi:SAM-dependent methyltransferase